MTDQDQIRNVWPLPLAVVCAVACFAATFFQIAEGVRLKEPRGWSPIVIGTIAFAALMLFLTDAMIAQKDRRRFGLSVAVVVAEAAAFFLGQVFLMLNVYGS